MSRFYSIRPPRYSDAHGLARTLTTLLIIAILSLGLYLLLTTPDQRSLGQRFDQAVDDLREGKSAKDAARTLERRTPGQKIGDAVKDAGDKIKDNTAVQ
ncbi:MAG: hypothetical protein EB060_04495 [Proteobacteria bacterium]|nr:hypothetical protein [Pseudomonadota bacterium]